MYPRCRLPVETVQSSITICRSTKLTANVEAYRKAGGGNVLLMRSKNGITISDLATLRSALPERTRLYLANGNKELWLRVSNTRGTTILFR